ncbi:plasmid pRiA4b ORF-3 family protein [Cupriavidus sp. 2MCAB6]|uniref:plasmid pRiA4b ORF-3 family protein n=1 Tax=Cupriavidus sp. 2MCAB6 TaxID=3232981 RepID=UPI003F933804
MASDRGPAISVLQLRIALRGLSPPVWRRVLVPEHLTLGQLHNVIQVDMGWADEHLHTFSIRGRRARQSEGYGQPSLKSAMSHLQSAHVLRSSTGDLRSPVAN